MGRARAGGPGRPGSLERGAEGGPVWSPGSEEHNEGVLAVMLWLGSQVGMTPPFRDEGENVP